MVGYGENSDRPTSSQLVDLHVYVVPPTLWRDHLHSAVNEIVGDTVSAGFIRVQPELRVEELRAEIEEQLGDELLPKEFIFLRSVGRCLTQVRTQQERELKAKHFRPPHAYLPELFLLDAAAGARQSELGSVADGRSRVSSRTSRWDYGVGGDYPTGTYPDGAVGRVGPGPNGAGPGEGGYHGVGRMGHGAHPGAPQPGGEGYDQYMVDPDNPDAMISTRSGGYPVGAGGPGPGGGILVGAGAHRNHESGQSPINSDDDTSPRTRRKLKLKRRTESGGEETDSSAGSPIEDGPPPRLSSASRTEQRHALIKLRAELEAAQKNRTAAEKQREDLVHKAKQLQIKTQNRRSQARDVWKKRYYEEKKKSPALEEEVSRLRRELDANHRRLLHILEQQKETPTAAPNEEGKNPSQKNNYRIAATRVKNTVDGLRQRVETAKMRLTTEMKLRNQAETELRALRAELTQKKIGVTLTRKAHYLSPEQLSPRPEPFLTGRQDPGVSPRSDRSSPQTAIQLDA